MSPTVRIDGDQSSLDQGRRKVDMRRRLQFGHQTPKSGAPECHRWSRHAECPQLAVPCRDNASATHVGAGPEEMAHGSTMTGILHQAGGQRSLSCEKWEGHVLQSGYAAVIFDCDGTLIDSEDAHFSAFAQAVKDQGHVLERTWYNKRTGLDRLSLLRSFQDTVAPDLDVLRAVEESIAHFIKSGPRVALMPQTSALVSRLKGRLPIAVSTNAERSIVTASLTAVGLIGAFDAVTSISDDVRPKPAPDLFLLAAQRLTADPLRTLVFEDSAQGVAAAQAAGMDVIAV
ncbi:MAG: HAD family phosphatase [Rhodobacteraceae bacterium]|nr:HAD family phosphatase [Paracoccaceae bacterium]